MRGDGDGGHGDTGSDANAEPDSGGERGSVVSGSREAEFGVRGCAERRGGGRGACAGEVAAVAMRRRVAGSEFAGSGCARSGGADTEAVSADRSGTGRSGSDDEDGREGRGAGRSGCGGRGGGGGGGGGKESGGKGGKVTEEESDGSAPASAAAELEREAHERVEAARR